MVVGLLTLELHFPHARSLKDKRRELQGLKDRLRRHNAAVAELDHQDVWQRTRLGIVTLNADASIVESILDAALRDVEAHLNGVIVQAERRFL
ncbi:MAG: DUF503 domain-containing protein [Acidobacteriota bacterium]|nr:DUF503 domain-containing protein [Acidobacteriota bacterium]